MAKMKRKQEEIALEALSVTVPEIYKGWYLECLHTGSRVICNPPPVNTDDDYMFLVHEGHRGALEARLKSEGFIVTGIDEYPNQRDPDDDNFGGFISFRKDDKNILLTESPEYFEKWSNATRLAQKLNLLKKEDRVALFEAVTRDVWPKERGMYRNTLNGIKWDLNIFGNAGAVNRGPIEAGPVLDLQEII